MASSLMERYASQIVGSVACLDRVLIMGTLPGACYPEGLTRHLKSKGIRIFDYAKVFAAPLTQRVRENAERLAEKAGLAIEFLRKRNIRKEDRIARILQERGGHPGLVHIFSAMEPCVTYKPWHDKASGRTYLKRDRTVCLHYYFYFIDRELGLCYLRVPTYCPFRLQFYFNGHNWLKRKLEAEGIACELIDNVIVACGDWTAAQRLSAELQPERLHALLDGYARRYCPAAEEAFDVDYHWSVMQAEYASDIVFKSAAVLAGLYESITRQAVCVVKAEQVASFLGKKLNGAYQGEVGSTFSTRIAGTCLRHHMGWKATIKIYDKLGLVLRIETTVNDLSFFRHYRKVEHRDGRCSFKQAPLSKSIYSLPTFQDLAAASNRRYLAFVSALADENPGILAVKKLAEKRRDREQDRSARGFNLLQEADHELFLAIARGQFAISGMTNKRLREVLKNRTGPQLSRLLRGLRLHGVIRRIGRTYKYYLTALGRSVVAAALKLRDLVIVPTLAQPA